MNKDFKDYQELFTWLLEGKDVRHNFNGYIYCLKDNNKFIRKVDNYICKDFIIDIRYFSKIINWYDDIPKQGVLCKCWNTNKDNYDIQRILGYVQKNKCPFKARFNAFMNAVPLTKEEVLNLIYQEN